MRGVGTVHTTSYSVMRTTTSGMAACREEVGGGGEGGRRAGGYIHDQKWRRSQVRGGWEEGGELHSFSYIH